MWPFSHNPSRFPSTRSRRSNSTLRFESLENRAMMTGVLNLQLPINTQVLDFAQAHVAQIVGNGQCATLAQDAVQSANGVPLYQLGPSGPNANYVWGKLVATLTPGNANVAGIQPGDILQFSNVVEVDTMTVHNQNGTTSTSTSYQYPSHHTAIVEVVGGSFSHDIQVLQANVQDYNGEPIAAQERVQGGDYWGGSSTYHLNYPQYGFSITVTHAMTSGVIDVYQPYENIPIYLR